MVNLGWIRHPLRRMADDLDDLDDLDFPSPSASTRPPTIVGHVGTSDTPPQTPENFVCVRGPCVHYWEMETHFDHGNAPGTFESLKRREPRKITRTCTAGLEELDLNDTPVYYCSRWTPQSRAEIEATKMRRDQYHAGNTEISPQERPQYVFDEDQGEEEK